MEDYVNRSDVLERFTFEHGDRIPEVREDGKDNTISFRDAKAVIRCVPSADVAPVVHARWVECDWLEPCVHGFGTIRYANKGLKCTNCVHVFKNDILWKDNYCPNCGAKMDGKGE